jgi:hypothetical protein
MRLAVPLALLLACASSPQPPSERPLGGTGSIRKDDATLDIRSLYSVKPDRSVEIYVDLTASGAGTVGPLDVELKTGGFLFDGPSNWRGEVAANTTTRATFVLRPQGDGGKWVKIITRRDGAEASSFTPLLVTPDEIRLCAADDEPCKGITDPAPATP